MSHTPHHSKAFDAAMKLARAAHSAVDGCLPPLTGIDRCLPKLQTGKTKPSSPPKHAPPRLPTARLKPRLLAVARLLAEGKTNPQIAQELGVTRQAVWKWARDPGVLVEIERAHQALIRTRARESLV